MNVKNILLGTIMTALFAGHNVIAQGSYCPSSSPLTGDYEMPLDGYNYNFTDNATTPSQIRVGYNNCNPTTVARFNVLNDALQAAGYFQTRLVTSTVAVGTANIVNNTGGDAVGMYAETVSDGGTNATGIVTQVTDNVKTANIHTGISANAANGASQSFAVNGDVKNSTSPNNFGYQTEIYNSISTSVNHGFHGLINTPGAYNYGAFLSVSGASVNNYGVYASVPPNSGGTINYAGYFNGDVHSTGVVTWVSDKKTKENISSFTGASQILNSLNPVTFDYKRTGIYERMNLPTEHQYGLIAQEVETILPTFVKDVAHPAEYDTLGNKIAPSIEYKSLNYSGLIPILVQGHREQSAQIDSLKSSNTVLQATNNELQAQVKTLNDRLTQLENCLSGVLPHLCQMSHNGIQQNTPQAQELIRQQLAVYLSDKTAIVLDQNVPNPFAEQTVISFSVPETVKQAQIMFYNGRGELIKTIDIRERGLGSLTVYGADLSSGTYMYTLVADGMIVATKKMVKQ